MLCGSELKRELNVLSDELKLFYQKIFPATICIKWCIEMDLYVTYYV